MTNVEQKYRGDIRILYGESQAYLRQLLRNAIVSEGYGGIEDYANVKGLETAINSGWPDLLVIDAELPGGDCCDLVESIRHNETGENPFLAVIFTLWKAEPDTVRRIVNCGVDDLLVNPISPAQLLARIDTLVFNRKPFVVTSDYIGPDRRDENDRDEGVPAIEVPNTLKQRAMGGHVDYEEMRSMIDDAMVTINEQRLPRHSYQIAFLVRRISDGLAKSGGDTEVSAHIGRLSSIARDVGARLAGTRYEHVSDLCNNLIDTAGRIALKPQNPAPKDIELLKPLSDALVVGFNPDRKSADMATEINAMLQEFAARTAQK